MPVSLANGSSPSTLASAVCSRSNPSHHSASEMPALPPNIEYSTLVEHPTSPAIRRIVNASGPSVSSNRLAASRRTRRWASRPAAYASPYGVPAAGFAITPCRA